MTNKIVVNCSTSEVQEIALTTEEIAEREAMAVEYAAQQAVEEAAKVAALAAKESANAKLAALGLTAEEIAALSN